MKRKRKRNRKKEKEKVEEEEEDEEVLQGNVAILDMCLSFHARYGVPVLQASSRSPWTPYSEGPAKSSSATGHTATFLAYHVFMLDARNCHENVSNNSLATITVCVT